VEEHLLLKAAEDEGIEVASEELRRSEPQAREGGEPQAVMENRLVGDFRALRLEPEAYLRVRKLMDEKVLDDVRVTDEEIAHYYEENRAYYKRPEVVDISQILVETAEEAEAILKDLQARPSRFQELARERSIAPEGDRGGHLGPFRRGELPPSFEKEVFGLRKGKLTHVVKTDFGYHIFRVDEMRPAKQLSLGEAEDAIRVKLLREKSDEALAIYLEELRKRYSVKVHTDRLSFPVPGITHGSR
ncbi:MAG: peptidylprolyl isomerase, partial [Acidobacteriota bacterium]